MLPALTLMCAFVAQTPPPWAVDGVDVQATIDKLTLEQKVGQTLLLGFGGTRMDTTIAAFLDEMQPGGIALFTRNINRAEQTMALIEAVRAHDPRVDCGDVDFCAPALPMFVSVDQEGGNVVRLKDDALILPSAMALGAAGDPTLAHRVGKALGEDLRLWGFNMNLAPVLDVSSNPKNPVIGVRSFGGDPARVGEIGTAYIHGLGAAGVVAVAKHFPGHGDTDTDSHYAMPVLQHDRERLFSVELMPFSRAFSHGLPAIMTAHIALPRIAEGKDIPATVSNRVLTGVLREELGFDGLVVTDGLEMQGVIDKYGAGEAAVRAIVAGADMVMVLWFPEKKKEVQQAITDAVKSGRIPQARLDQAVRRVLEHKAKAGLFSEKPLDTTHKLAMLRDKKRSAARRDIQREVATRAITVVKNGGVLPLAPTEKASNTVAIAPVGAFLTPFKQAGASTVLVPMAPTKDRAQKDIERAIAVAQKQRGADAPLTIVVAVYTSDHISLVRALMARIADARVVVVSFGSPWLLNAFPQADATVCSFGWRDDSALAAAHVVLGDKKATGVLPVMLAGVRVMTAGASR